VADIILMISQERCDLPSGIDDGTPQDA